MFDPFAFARRAWPGPEWKPEPEPEPDPDVEHHYFAFVGLAGLVEFHFAPDLDEWFVSAKQAGVERSGEHLAELLVGVRDELAAAVRRTLELCQGPAGSGPSGRVSSLVFPPPVRLSP